MVPSFISALMTSTALTDMRCASSPTVMVSGTGISRATSSLGWLNEVCCSAVACAVARTAARMPAGDAAAHVAARLDGAAAHGIVAHGGGRLGLLGLLVDLAHLARLRRVQRALDRRAGDRRLGLLDRCLRFARGGLLLRLAALALLLLAHFRRLQSRTAARGGALPAGAPRAPSRRSTAPRAAEAPPGRAPPPAFRRRSPPLPARMGRASRTRASCAPRPGWCAPCPTCRTS